jgi:hypothetical protein
MDVADLLAVRSGAWLGSAGDRRWEVDGRQGFAPHGRRSGRPASAATARLRSRARRYGLYRYFLIFGLLTFAFVTIAAPVP